MVASIALALRTKQNPAKVLLVPTPEDRAYELGLAGIDPAALTTALGAAAVRLARRPAKTAVALADLALEQTAVGLDMAAALLDSKKEPIQSPDPGDRRFEDRAWRESPLLRGAFESYLATSRWSQRVLDSLELSEATRNKARFALGLGLDALSPSNVAFLNPAVVKEAVDTGGRSLVRGAANFVDDVIRHGGQPSQVDTSGFELGRNLAATPGRVVHRNELIELIAYEPQTETVYAEPILVSPPWINKYYILDLAPDRSLIEFAVRQGFTVFAISYRNPDASMADLTLSDYLRDGLLEALDRVLELTGSPRANILSLCVGGTMATIGLAVLAARQAERVGWATLLNTPVDFSDPGEIGVFTDEAAIERIERRIKRRGYMKAEELAGPFNLMRGNDLLWRYVVSNWLMGKQPPAFDILAWNADATRLPAAMHAEYLRTCYLRNLLVQPGAFTIDGTPVDLSRIETPLYVVGAENDHIVLWRSSYRTTQVVSGESRFLLTSGGHIAGAVNPPGSPRASYRTRDESPSDPDAWLAGAGSVQGSWWEDWAEWAAARSGERVEPPSLPPGDPAPGEYVRG
jgi:polyhydroxyalkanoate synthase